MNAASLGAGLLFLFVWSAAMSLSDQQVASYTPQCRVTASELHPEFCVRVPECACTLVPPAGL